MSLWYKISPELNLILYVGQGWSSPSDFFALEEAAFLQYPRPRGMITLVDAEKLSTAFELHDIRRFIDKIGGMTKSGMEPGPYFMITKDWGLHLMSEAARLMAGNIDLKARMYFTLEEAIVTLGLSDQRSEIIQLWEECRLELKRASSDT